jgi:hypothetical protein
VSLNKKAKGVANMHPARSLSIFSADVWASGCTLTGNRDNGKHRPPPPRTQPLTVVPLLPHVSPSNGRSKKNRFALATDSGHKVNTELRSYFLTMNMYLTAFF